ncbi:MAG: hypothetical protein HY040_07950 [Planctomycetes bacterium]|nr:hypothetical protein [Planctomycetota bacterium]
MKALGEAALDLPWLAPCATNLAALTRPDAASVWADVRLDPGSVLLLCRNHDQRAFDEGRPIFSAIQQSEPLELALAQLESDQLVARKAGFVDWAEPFPSEIYHAAVRQALLAHALAQRTKRCDPELAWVGGLLAPLGWLAVAAVAKHSGPSFAREFEGEAPVASAHVASAPVASAPVASAPVASTHVASWGIDHASLTRRLCRTWQLPGWLSAILGNLGLHAAVAEKLGADSVLFQIVSLSVGLLQRDRAGVRLEIGTPLSFLLESLDLSDEETDQLVGKVIDAPVEARSWTAPASQPLLVDLLRLAVQQRSNSTVARTMRLEQECDLLYKAIAEQHAGEQKRLQEMKLKGLAELAAGAGHEINNPLAVISGQAQYLLRQLRQEELNLGVRTAPELVDNPRSKLQKSLQTIIGQTQRIHQVLTDLMQFARPASPRAQLVPVVPLVQEVVALHQDLAAQSNVRLLCDVPSESWLISVDLDQVRIILGRLLQNAIEAAPADGWASVRAENEEDAKLRIIIEDNGAGPTPDCCEHLFDPFYSGRAAGRGRGLGLSTAWRLARHNGGELSFERAGAVTRFQLALPLAAAPMAASPEPDPMRNGHTAESNGRSIHPPVSTLT